jgi:hypothetical protein
MPPSKINPISAIYVAADRTKRARSLKEEADTDFLLAYVEVGLALQEVAQVLLSQEDAACCRKAALQAHDTILDLLSVMSVGAPERAFVEQRWPSLKSGQLLAGC